MAKSKSFFGLRRGSTKSLTFQVLDGQQITKDRVTSVRNPKSNGQIMQRMKLASATIIYRYFKPYIDRGQQGVSYGKKSRQAWLKAILSGAPLYVAKGSADILPWTFPLTKGSLAPFTYTYDGESNLQVEEGADPDLAAMTDEVLVSLNPQMQMGDQITVIVMSKQANGSFLIRQASKILNGESTFNDVMNENHIDLDFKTVSGLNYAVLKSMDGTAVGTCIILSRLNGAAYERSTQAFIGNDQMFTADFRQAAIDSFRDAEQRSSDWPEVPEEGFIPTGKTDIIVKGLNASEQPVTVAAALAYGFIGNEYKLYAVTNTGDSEGYVVDINGNTSALLADDAKVTLGATEVALGDYVSGYIDTQAYEEIHV